MKNQGISLISLIITIIVIIILAAIVIFTGLGTPDSANFAKFCSSCDDVQMAVLDAYSDLRVEHAMKGDTRNEEQLYLEVATGSDSSQTAKMSSAGKCQNINISGETGDAARTVGSLVLPKVKESREGWYITANGRVFNANGYDYDDKTYFNASVYSATVVTSGDATEIASTIMSGETIVD